MKTDKPYSGVLVPVTTPFDSETGDVEPVALRDNVRAMLERGASGVLVAGSTGEAAMLGDEECRSMVGWLRDVVPDDCHVMIGAGRESTRATIAACAQGAEEGADTALVRAPAYFSASLLTQDLVDHFRRVADESPIPVFVYNIPKYTHIQIEDAVLRALADHPNIHGAKDSCGDLKNFAAYRDAVPEWSLFVGSGALLYPALELGGVGGILAVANFATRMSADIYQTFQDGEPEKAGALQERLTPLHKGIVQGMGPAGVKKAMEYVGLAGGPMRPPLKAVGEARSAEIATLLHSAEIETVEQ